MNYTVKILVLELAHDVVIVVGNQKLDSGNTE